MKNDKARVEKIDGLIAETEQSASLAPRLKAIVKGTDQPKNAAEGVAFATMCLHKKRYVLAARLFEQAFRDDPKLAEIETPGHRYNAACSASLAASAQGIDDAKPNDEEKIRLRKQALEWLKADLKTWTGQVEIANQKPIAAQILGHWRNDPDLAGVREEAGLKTLPEDEQTAWRTLEASRRGDPGRGRVNRAGPKNPRAGRLRFHRIDRRRRFFRRK